MLERVEAFTSCLVARKAGRDFNRGVDALFFSPFVLPSVIFGPLYLLSFIIVETPQIPLTFSFFLSIRI